MINGETKMEDLKKTHEMQFLGAVTAETEQLRKMAGNLWKQVDEIISAEQGEYDPDDLRVVLSVLMQLGNGLRQTLGAFAQFEEARTERARRKGPNLIVPNVPLH